MATPQAEPVAFDQNPLKMAVAPVDAINGKTEVNGHVSPVDLPPASELRHDEPHEEKLASVGVISEPNHDQNHDAYSANKEAPAPPPAHDSVMDQVSESAPQVATMEEPRAPDHVIDHPREIATITEPAPDDMPILREPEETVESVTVTAVIAEAAEAPSAATAEALPTAVPEVSSAPVSLPPAQPTLPSLEEPVAEPPPTAATEPSVDTAAASSAAPAVESVDVEMLDERAEPIISSSADDGDITTQATVDADTHVEASQDDAPLHPASMSSLAIDASHEDLSITADTSMTDLAPRSPIKVAREREEDDGDEPATKRAKFEDAADEIQAAAPQAMEIDSATPSAALLNEDGKPKSLADPSLDDTPLTQYQIRQIRQVLALVKKTKAGVHFKQSVVQLWPHLADSYLEKVKDPVDISLMEKKLRGEDGVDAYRTMGDFKHDVQLLYENCVLFNGPQHDVTKAAENVKDTIYHKMAPLTAVEVPRPEKKESKHHPSRHTEARAVSQQHKQPPKAQAEQQTPSQADKQAARRQSRGAASSPVDKTAPADQAIEAQAYAVPPTGVPVIRRGSAKGDSDRPKRPVHPPKRKDIGFEPKKKKKLTPELRFCDEVITELLKSKYHDFNAPFVKPVDPIAIGIPSYWSIVKKPMDLETMQNKIYDGSYNGNNGFKEFERDFRQIVKNSQLFNGPDHEVTQQAIKLEDVFDRELAKRDQWMAKHAPSAISTSTSQAGGSGAQVSPKDDESDEDDGDASDNEPDPADAQDLATLESLTKNVEEQQAKLNELLTDKQPNMSMIELQQNIVTMVQKSLVTHKMKMAEREQQNAKKPSSKPKASKSKKAAGGAGSGGGKKAGAAGGKRGGAAAGGSKKAATKARVMGAVEKEVITTGITELDGNGLERAIEIIKADTNQNENDSGELELDIEQLSNEALTKLYNLITKAFPELRAQKEQSYTAAQAPATSSQKAGKPKKNKPMGKDEQEQKIAHLQDLKAQIQRTGSGSQEPIPSIENDAGVGSSVQVDTTGPLLADDSEEESSEEE